MMQVAFLVWAGVQLQIIPALPAAAAAPPDAERSGPEPGDKPVPIGDAPSRDRNAPPAPISNSGTTESGAAGPTPGPGSPPPRPGAPHPGRPSGTRRPGLPRPRVEQPRRVRVNACDSQWRVKAQLHDENQPPSATDSQKTEATPSSSKCPR